MSRPKKYDEAQVLDQMMHVFWQQGYEATSMRHLESATNLSPSSIYNAFGNKKALFEQTLAFYIKTVIDKRIEQHLIAHEDPLDGIRQFFTTTFYALPKSIEKRSCLLVNSAAELGQSEPLIGTTIRHGFKRVEQALENALIDSKNKGCSQTEQQSQQVKSNLDCSAAAKQLGLLLPGFLIAVRNNADPENLATSLDFTLNQFID